VTSGNYDRTPRGRATGVPLHFPVSSFRAAEFFKMLKFSRRLVFFETFLDFGWDRCKKFALGVTPGCIFFFFQSRYFDCDDVGIVPYTDE